MTDQDGNLIDLFEKERKERLSNAQMLRDSREVEDAAWIIIWIAVMSMFWFILYLVYRLVW